MESYLSTNVLPVSSGQNSLQGALKIGHSSASEQVPQQKRATAAAAAVAVTALESTAAAPNIVAGIMVADNAVKAMAASLGQDMQRQLEEFNQTVTIIFWYKVSLSNELLFCKGWLFSAI